MLKRTPLKRIGRQGKINLCANRKIAQMWEEFGVNTCEIRLKGCLGNYLLQNCHRRKRMFYYKHLELLYARKEVIRGCQNCHNQIEHSPKLTEDTFKRLRK